MTTIMALPDTDISADVSEEQLAILHNRYHEARRAGLDDPEARVFAHNGVDVGLLRFLVANHCPPVTISRIVL